MKRKKILKQLKKRYVTYGEIEDSLRLGADGILSDGLADSYYLLRLEVQNTIELLQGYTYCDYCGTQIPYQPLIEQVKVCESCDRLMTSAPEW